MVTICLTTALVDRASYSLIVPYLHSKLIRLQMVGSLIVLGILPWLLLNVDMASNTIEDPGSLIVIAKPKSLRRKR
jgi:hypothetical protein